MAEPIASQDRWTQGDVYETYMGQWTRLVAREFISWLGVIQGKRWLDVGCGTGALTETILAQASPESVVGVDQSEGFIEYASQHITDPRARFAVADAQDLKTERGGFEVVVSGLVLNFVPKPERMALEMARSSRLNGKVGVYVWDYAEGFQFMRHFWDAAVALDPAARELDEGVRFPMANAKAIWNIFLDAGLNDVVTRSIVVPMHWNTFDDLWNPFLGGVGPAPSYVMSLSDEKRAALREQLRKNLPIKADGSIDLTARAWAVKGTR